ncbi:MAG: hypothetical protein Q8941_15680 [Bacteroidota bacterium]|nr:hypothetical protein [Bacteroidota bacterium]
MRNFLLIILTSIHLFGNTEISQVLRIPNLVTHYFEHCRLNPGITFFQFLNMHYGGNDGTHADDSKDNQLPCHNLHHNTLSVVCYKIQDIPSLELVTRYNTREYGKPLLTYHPQEHVFSFFQPPKAA